MFHDSHTAARLSCANVVASLQHFFPQRCSAAFVLLIGLELGSDSGLDSVTSCKASLIVPSVKRDQQVNRFQVRITCVLATRHSWESLNASPRLLSNVHIPASCGVLLQNGPEW